MSYLSQLSKIGSAIGSPPTVQPKAIGTAPGHVPAAQPHISPPPYDSAMDPAWKGLLDPADHEMRNALNELSPELRQLFLTRLQALISPKTPAASILPSV